MQSHNKPEDHQLKQYTHRQSTLQKSTSKDKNVSFQQRNSRSKEQIQNNTLFKNEFNQNRNSQHQTEQHLKELNSLQYSMEDRSPLKSHFQSVDDSEFQSGFKLYQIQQNQNTALSLKEEKSQKQLDKINTPNKKVSTNQTKKEQNKSSKALIDSSEQSQDKQLQSEQKIIHYRSSLHQIVDKNHLESPTKKKKQQEENLIDWSPQIIRIKSQDINISKKLSQEKNAQQLNPKQILLQPLSEQIVNLGKKQQKMKTQQKTKNQSQKTKIQQSPQSTKKSPVRKSIKYSVRRIPSKILGSYDELSMTIDKLLMPNNKKNRNKNEKPPTSQNRQQNNKYNQELFAQYCIIEGYCTLKVNQNYPIQTKFIIIKNILFFQVYQKIYINQIKKIKLLEKQKELFVKITLVKNEEQNKKNDVLLMSLMTSSQETYFRQTFEVFSQLILRKLLLMNILVNTLNEQYQAQESQDDYVYQNQLFKKAQFFNSWERRKLVLSVKNSLLQSFKGNKCSYEINSIPELWTRFQMINGYLVMKMWHKYEKIQIGVPLCDFSDRKAKHNWLFGLSKLVKEK